MNRSHAHASPFLHRVTVSLLVLQLFHVRAMPCKRIFWNAQPNLIVTIKSDEYISSFFYKANLTSLFWNGRLMPKYLLMD
jgi:hypothetical protein